MHATLKQPLFIIGLQKSGTTLLNRLLIEQSDYFFSPFKLEGRQFWGDDPPFAPVKSPCGEIYQKYSGLYGHSATKSDYDRMHQEILYNRLRKVTLEAPVLINKNPYNTVRIPWLKEMFPSCKIIAMVRNPCPNVFSLLKKHIPHKGRGLGPENGWWGVKPLNWQDLIDNNLLSQLAKQWREVNKEIIKHHDNIDLTLNYKDLCGNPNFYLSSILALYGKKAHLDIPTLTCLDNEYKHGSRLLSKNRIFQKNQNLQLKESVSDTDELKPLNRFDIATIRFRTWNTALKLKKLTTTK
ncbi:MAG: sulfotransferase family protein [Marinicella pacifica]